MTGREGPDRWTVDLAVGPLHHEAVLTVGSLWRSGGRAGRLIDPLLRPIARRSIAAFCRDVARTIDAQVPTTPGGGS